MLLPLTRTHGIGVEAIYLWQNRLEYQKVPGSSPSWIPEFFSVDFSPEHLTLVPAYIEIFIIITIIGF